MKTRASKAELELMLAEFQLSKLESERCLDFLDYLLEVNLQMNLTALTSASEIKTRHLEDSWQVLKHLDYGARVLDLGSGAGFPGIPLKIRREDLDLTLLDSRAKRVNFLNQVISRLKLKSIRATQARAENFARKTGERESYDYVLARAVAPMPVLLEYSLPFLKLGGLLLALKSQDEAELKAARPALAILGGEIEDILPYVLAGETRAKQLYLIRKIKASSKLYPRPDGEPKRRPLG